MKKIAKFAMLSSALVFSQIAVANAAPPSGTLTGTNVYVEKFYNFYCDLEINFVVEGGKDKAYISLKPGNPLCAALQFNNAPYEWELIGTDTVWFKGIDVTTVSVGDCAGDIYAGWDGTTLSIDTTLPAKTSGNDCVVIGDAS